MINGRDLPGSLSELITADAPMQHWTSRSRWGYWLRQASILCCVEGLNEKLSTAISDSIAKEKRSSYCFVTPNNSETTLQTLLAVNDRKKLADTIRKGAVFVDREKSVVYACNPTASSGGWFKLQDGQRWEVLSLDEVLQDCPELTDDILRTTEHEIDALLDTADENQLANIAELSSRIANARIEAAGLSDAHSGVFNA